MNLSLEPSTRTRLAFEVAASRLGADIITMTGNASSLTKGESLRDTAQNIAALGADMIIMRHSASGAPNYLSKVVDIPVIHAGAGPHPAPLVPNPQGEPRAGPAEAEVAVWGLSRGGVQSHPPRRLRGEPRAAHRSSRNPAPPV